VLGDCLWFVFIFSLLQMGLCMGDFDGRGDGVSSTAVTERSQGMREPVMGPLARRACSLSIEGEKRRRLVVLLAAFADANDGACAPSTEALLERIPAIGNAGKLYGLVRRLADDGLVRQLPRGAGYELTFLDDVAGGE
jgi:hypothetical protein